MSRSFRWTLLALFALGSALFLWRLNIGAQEPLMETDIPVSIQRAPKFIPSPEESDTRENYVYDRAQFLTEAQRKHMSEFLKFVHKQFDMEMVVITVEALPPGASIVTWGAMKMEELQIGAKTANGRKGLLFAIALKEQLVRMEVGYELEELYPDAVVSYYENQMMKPYFAHNQVHIGLEATVEHFVSRAMRNDTSPLGDYAVDKESLTRSGGGGATTKAPIDQPEDYIIYRASDEERAYYSPQPTPWETANRNREASCRRILDPTLPMFTEVSRNRNKFKITTKAQIGKPCDPKTTPHTEKQFVIQGSRAVIFRHRVSRKNGLGWSFYLQNAQGLWELDRSTTFEYVRYNFQNDWGFFCGYPEPYMFAFQHWCYDKYGYPYDKIPFLGITSSNAERVSYDWSANTRKAMELYQRHIVLTHVVPDSPAEKGGLKEGDLLLEVHGRQIHKTYDVKLSFRRNYKTKAKNYFARPDSRDVQVLYDYFRAPKLLFKVARGSEVFEITVEPQWRCPDNDPPYEAFPLEQAQGIHEPCTINDFTPIDWSSYY